MREISKLTEQADVVVRIAVEFAAIESQRIACTFERNQARDVAIENTCILRRTCWGSRSSLLILFASDGGSFRLIA